LGWSSPNRGQAVDRRTDDPTVAGSTRSPWSYEGPGQPKNRPFRSLTTRANTLVSSSADW
jgi:hypothetical protein